MERSIPSSAELEEYDIVFGRHCTPMCRKLSTTAVLKRKLGYQIQNLKFVICSGVYTGWLWTAEQIDSICRTHCVTEIPPFFHIVGVCTL